MQSLDALKADEDAMRKALESGGAHFRGRTMKCIFHEDRTPSAGIYFKNGAWFFKCQGCGFGGDVIDVRAKLNKRTAVEELRAMNDAAGTAIVPFKKPDPPAKIFPNLEAIAAALPSVEDIYRDLYTDPETGRALFAVIRWKNTEGKKAFTQCSATTGGWIMKAPKSGLLPIANRKAIKDAARVVVVEGEKCVRRLADIGIVATTSPGGALKGDHADWSPLAGKEVILWPDMDTPDEKDPFYPVPKGAEHMNRVQKILQTLSPPPRIFLFNPSPLELPPKGDAADAIERYSKEFSKEQIRAIIEDALADSEPTGIAAEYTAEMEQTISGNRRSIPFAWDQITKMSRALLRGKVTCVCGDGGSGKSLWISDCIVDWYQMGIKTCVYHLEDDRNYHLQRIHCQLENDSRYTDAEWIELNPEYVRESLKRRRSDFEAIGRTIWEAPADDVSQEMLLLWMEERAKSGFEILVIDPITAASTAKQPWVEDLKFITKTKLIARRYGCRIIFVTHPRSGTKTGKATHNDMAGGASFPRFAHTVFWIERNDSGLQCWVKRSWDYAAEWLAPNRFVCIAKARNGPGAGNKIAFNFNSQTLRFEELGYVVKETPPQSE